MPLPRRQYPMGGHRRSLSAGRNAGFYRGTRFDWSASFATQFAGHEYYGAWFRRFNPRS